MHHFTRNDPIGNRSNCTKHMINSTQNDTPTHNSNPSPPPKTITKNKRKNKPKPKRSSPFSYRLELMRQIYNIESPPSPNVDPSVALMEQQLSQQSSQQSSQYSIFKCPLTTMTMTPSTFTPTEQLIGLKGGGQPPTGEFLRCLNTCANTSRLTLTNLLPSRFG